MFTLCSPWLTGLAIAAIAADASFVQTDDTELPTAAASENIWFVAPRPGADADTDQWRLCLHALDMGGPHFRCFFTLPRLPEAMAAFDNRVWLIFPPQRGTDAGSDLRRDVYSVRATKLPVQDLYVTEPPDRMTLEAPLVGGVRLIDFAPSRNGPLALLLPAGPDTDDPPPAPTLIRLTTDWRDIQLPDELPDARAWRLATDRHGERIWLLAAHPNDRSQTHAWLRDETGEWRMISLELRLDRVRSFTEVGGRLAALLVDDAGRRSEIVYIRTQGVLLLTQIPALRGRWNAIGVRDGMRIIEVSTLGEYHKRSVNMISGRVGESVAMTTQPVGATRVMHIPIVMAAMIGTIIIWLILRPRDTRRIPTLPENVVPFPFVPRIGALVIDLLPGGILAALILDRPFSELLLLPAWSEDLQRSQAALLMVGLTIAHGTASELFWGTTLGKSFFGARVVRVEDASPTPAHLTLLRNAVKTIVLLIPPLGVLAILHPNLQGIGEMITGTAVVCDRSESADSQESNEQPTDKRTSTDE